MKILNKETNNITEIFFELPPLYKSIDKLVCKIIIDNKITYWNALGILEEITINKGNKYKIIN